MIHAIVAYERHRGIGMNNNIPWQGDLPADSRHFRTSTLGHAVIMGRRTFDSLDKPLKGRQNIVITTQDSEFQTATAVSSVPEALRTAEIIDRNPFIIGGAAVYAAALAETDMVIATEIDASFECDTFFPELTENEWRVRSREPHAADEYNKYNFEIVIYERKK